MLTAATSGAGSVERSFLDRLRGMETLRIFGRGEAETENIRPASQDFRQRTMEVLRMAFLSSGVLEFSPPVDCAGGGLLWFLLPRRAGLWSLRYGGYAFRWVPALIRPGIFPAASRSRHLYHAKAQAVGAADSLKTFMETPLAHPERGEVTLNTNDPVTIEAQNFLFCRLKAKYWPVR